jgi:phage gp36-like protein
MAYATAAELRERYRQGIDTDEFTEREDGELDLALQAAADEIDSYRPAGELTAAATAILRDKSLTLARMLAHQDAALDLVHPIVRDAQAVRDWLLLLARGVVHLPQADAASGGSGAEWQSVPTVWGRGDGGGL